MLESSYETANVGGNVNALVVAIEVVVIVSILIIAGINGGEGSIFEGESSSGKAEAEAEAEDTVIGELIGICQRKGGMEVTGALTDVMG